MPEKSQINEYSVSDVIHHHEEKIRTYTYVMITNFGVKCKYVGGFQKSNISYIIFIS